MGSGGPVDPPHLEARAGQKLRLSVGTRLTSVPFVWDTVYGRRAGLKLAGASPVTSKSTDSLSYAHCTAILKRYEAIDRVFYFWAMEAEYCLPTM